MSTTGKVITWTSLIAVLALAGFIFFKFCFVYSEGVNEGDINYFQKDLRGKNDPDRSEIVQEPRCYSVERVQILRGGRAHRP